MRLFLLIIVGCFGTNTLKSQDLFLNNLYQVNYLQLNPAYTGNQSLIRINLLLNRPITNQKSLYSHNYVSFDMPINQERVGIGAYVKQEKMAGYSNIDGLVSYSYKIKIAKGLLAFGLNAGFSQFKVDFDMWKRKDQDDELLKERQIQTTKPNFNFGLLYNKKNLNIGLGINHLQNNYLISNRIFRIKRIYNFNLEYKSSISARWSFNQLYLIRSTLSTTNYLVQYTLSYSNEIWLGIGYRNNGFVNFSCGLQLNKINQALEKSKLFYAYETRLNNSLFGVNTHNIGLEFLFEKPKNAKNVLKNGKLISPTDL